jgi:AcrR family transcriptional regulator
MTDESLAAVLWSEPAVGLRGPRPRVDRAQITAAAVRIADEDGLESASMQRIAADVGVSKMALYRHVPGRTELVALMVEAAMGAAPDTSGPWRAGVMAWANAMRDRFSAHRWLPGAATGARLVGPTELAWMEAGLAALEALPLTGAERLDTLVLVGSHVRGIVQQDDGTELEHGMSTRLANVLGPRADAFPRTLAAFTQAAAAVQTDQAYAYGLARILDGVEALTARR